MKILNLFIHTYSKETILRAETKFLETQMIYKCQPLDSGIKDRDFANLILSIAANCQKIKSEVENNLEK